MICFRSHSDDNSMGLKHVAVCILFYKVMFGGYVFIPYFIVQTHRVRSQSVLLHIIHVAYEYYCLEMITTCSNSI